MSKSDFYDSLETLCVNYVKERDVDESELDIECFLQSLISVGLFVEQIEVDIEKEGVSRTVKAYEIKTGDSQAMEAVKATYFNGRYSEFKDMAERFTEKYFTDSSKIKAMKSLLEDDYSDCIRLKEDESIEETMTLDRFIRDMEPEMVYYLSPETILMH